MQDLNIRSAWVGRESARCLPDCQPVCSRIQYFGHPIDNHRLGVFKYWNQNIFSWIFPETVSGLANATIPARSPVVRQPQEANLSSSEVR